MKTLLPIAAAFAVCLWLAVSTPPAGHASSQADCSLTSTGMLPLTDMGLHRYRGQRGGLYPNGRNRPTTDYLRRGMAASRQVRKIDGKIVLLSVGMSNATEEFSAFKRVADRDL